MSFQGSPPALLPEIDQANENLRGQEVVHIPGYEIECEIGRGGMATVYRAVQQSLGRRVAIKVLAQQLNDDTEFAARFKREGRILAHLSHPNIVTIHDVGIAQDNRIFLSIEYLSGGTLKDRIKQGLSVDSTLKIIKAIAKALIFAHQNGIIHRDVKPSNIMFRHDGSPVLTDFGVARTIGAKTVHTMTGFIVGSPGYMSPEQAMGESATIQSDLYALGVVLYEMLVGLPLYQADNSLTIILKHLNDPIPKLPNQYVYLQPILNKLLAKKAAERYKNAGDFLDAVDLITPSDLRISSKTEAPDDQGILEFVSGKIQRRFSKKRPHFFIFSGSIGIIFLAIIIGYSFKSTTKMAENIQLPEKSANLIEKPVPRQASAKISAPLKTEQDRQQDLQLQAQQLLIQAQSNFQENALENSSAHIEKGLLSVPNHPELLALRERVRVRMVERRRNEELRQKQDEEIRRQAEIAERQKAEQARQQAKETQQRVEADRYLARALNHQRKSEYTASLQQIEKGLTVVPSHEDLLRLKEQVLTEESAAQQKEAVRRQATKVAKKKEPTPRKQPRTSPTAPTRGEDDAAKKLQDIRNSINALDQSLNR